MKHQHLLDELIIEGFRNGDSEIIREYFYGLIIQQDQI